MSDTLPAYELRISTRARHPQLRILPPDRVEAVIPHGMPAVVTAAKLVAAKKRWIERKLAHFAHLQAAHTDPGDTVCPEHVHLAAIDRRLRIEYRPTHAAGVRTRQKNDVLSLSGAVDDTARVRAALRRWLLATARSELPLMLHELAAEHGLRFRHTSVRYQKQRWGSCSFQGHIILNAKLLCLPRDLARHVMLHELAHLKHLNHSRSFWALLRQLDPNTEHHHTALRAAWLHTPAWLEAG